MEEILIFYSMISDSVKDKEIKLHGPFIHFKINESNINQYVFKKDKFDAERKYLSKYLREKSPDKIPMFWFAEIENIKKNMNDEIDLKKDINKYISFVEVNNLNESFNKYKSDNGLDDDVKTYVSFVQQIGMSKQFMDYFVAESKFEKIKNNAFILAGMHFEEKFKVMSENYSICSRKK